MYLITYSDSFNSSQSLSISNSSRILVLSNSNNKADSLLSSLVKLIPALFNNLKAKSV